MKAEELPPAAYDLSLRKGKSVENFAPVTVVHFEISSSDGYTSTNENYLATVFMYERRGIQMFLSSPVAL